MSSLNSTTMAFQVRVRMNKNKVEVLSVASSSYEFQKFTIKKLKSIALILFPGVDDPTRLRVVFGQDEPEDHQTFEECYIEHLSLLVIVLLTDGGGVIGVERPNKATVEWELEERDGVKTRAHGL